MENSTEDSVIGAPTHTQSRYFYPYWAFINALGEWVNFNQPNVPYVLKAALPLPNGRVLLVRHPITGWVNGQQISVAEDMTVQHIFVVRNSSLPPSTNASTGITES
jgi:hypothetical protein